MNLFYSFKLMVSLLGVLFFMIFQKINAQSIYNIQDVFDQTRQLLVISYEIKGLNFKKEIEVLPFISIDNGPIKVLTSKNLGGAYGWINWNDNVYNISWDPFKDGIVDLSNVKIELRTKVRDARITKFWGIGWHCSNSAPIGLKLSRYGLVGFSVGLRLGNTPPAYRYTVNQSGEMDYLESGVYIIGDKKRLAGYGISIGPIFQIARKIYLNTGVGYGLEQLFWEYQEYNLDKQFIGSSWALNDVINNRGVAFDLGISYKLDRILIDIGLSTIELKNFQLTGGVMIPIKNYGLKNRLSPK